MSFIVVIPARYASERLPGKPLADIAGKPMVLRVVECAKQSNAARVIVAADDQRVYDAVAEAGEEVMMTSPNHPSGTDRLHEVVTTLGLNDNDVVVNVQGDEPFIPASVINQVAENLLKDGSASCATLSEPVEDIETLFNPNAVKVVSDDLQHALYFSRASLPYVRGNYDSENPALPEGEVVQRHIGIYAYRVSLLKDFVQWSPASLEKLEKLEQLRILANGKSIHVEPACENVPGGVDTPEDLEKARKIAAEI